MCYNGEMPVTNERHDCTNQIKVTDLKHLRALIEDNVLIRGNDCSLNRGHQWPQGLAWLVLQERLQRGYFRVGCLQCPRHDPNV